MRQMKNEIWIANDIVLKSIKVIDLIKNKKCWLENKVNKIKESLKNYDNFDK